jgi:hypothetical protein
MREDKDKGVRKKGRFYHFDKIIKSQDDESKIAG